MQSSSVFEYCCMKISHIIIVDLQDYSCSLQLLFLLLFLYSNTLEICTCSSGSVIRPNNRIMMCEIFMQRYISPITIHFKVMHGLDNKIAMQGKEFCNM